MTSSNVARNARYGFAVALMGAGMYLGMDAYAASRVEETLSCGTESNPCRIEPLNVTAERGDVRFVDTEEAPAPVRSMMLTVRS